MLPAQKKTAAIIASCSFGLASVSLFFLAGLSVAVVMNMITALLWAMMASTAEDG